VIFCQGAF